MTDHGFVKPLVLEGGPVCDFAFVRLFWLILIFVEH
jgi:hypothetical protein